MSDGAILQRDTPVKLWGWASENENIELIFKNNSYKTTANSNGEWLITLPSEKAGGPYSITFKASNTITLQNILFGDVWICSGQSNMELPIRRVLEKYPNIAKNASNSNIRQFKVPQKYNFKEAQKDVEYGDWKEVTSENILDFSAVAYFFANELYTKNNVPIGLINTSLGGSPVEAWMSDEALKNFPEAYKEAEKFKSDDLIKSIQESDQKRMDDWYSELNKKDEGLKNADFLWNNPNLEDSDWQTMKIPGYWANEAIGNVNGVVWFRKEFNLPSTLSGKKAKLLLGRIVDQDYAYINGEMVGTVSYQYPPRIYQVKEGILKEGKNNITVRVINNSGKGGFVLDKPYFLVIDKDTVDLKGEWKYKLGTTMKPLESQTFIRWKPKGLYNAMISPLLNYNIKGAIWYQGESNTWNPSLYAQTFPAMVKDWRAKWNQGNFPFIYVQLANFMEEKLMPEESNWAEFRQVQLNALSIPNTGMAVIIDTGEWNDIHPLNKKDVGKRLALQAEKLAYNNTNIYASSPSPKKTTFKKDKVIITFKNVGSGLTAHNGKMLEEFAISNDGKNFVWAKAKIKGNKVIVWNTEVQNPIIVRYAWADNPSKANLFTKKGLPATPFEVKKK